jgi:hypothetical protein
LVGKEFRRSVSRKDAKFAKFGEIKVEAEKKAGRWRGLCELSVLAGE